MSAIDALSLLVPLTFILMLLAERLWPARRFPRRRGWVWLGFACLIGVALLSSLLPLLLPGDWLAAHRLVDGTGLGVAGGAVVGYLVYSFAAYAWHRATHRYSLLWRLAHQIHHSPQRVDMPGAVLFHPFDLAMYVVLQVLVSTFVLGLDPLAAAITGYIAAFYSFFQHCNIRTPAWLGYLIQRPESHCVHHQRGLHHYNFSDFPLWDILAGTFRNPARWDGEAGFDAPSDRRLSAMLGFTDVNLVELGEGSRGQRRERAMPPA